MRSGPLDVDATWAAATAYPAGVGTRAARPLRITTLSMAPAPMAYAAAANAHGSQRRYGHRLRAHVALGSDGGEGSRCRASAAGQRRLHGPPLAPLDSPPNALAVRPLLLSVSIAMRCRWPRRPIAHLA